MAQQTRIVFSDGLALTVALGLAQVRDALAQYEGGQAFVEFKTSAGDDVCVASAQVAYIERLPDEPALSSEEFSSDSALD
jgi:hypothetical protein